MKYFVLQVWALSIVAITQLGCSANDSDPNVDGGRGGTDTGGADAGRGSGGAALCQTPAAEDLFPRFDFSTDDGSFELNTGSTCVRPNDFTAEGGEGGRPAGGPPGGGPPPGGPGGGPGGPPSKSEGGAPPGPGGDTIRRVAVGLPNSLGRHADQIMPDVALDGDVASLDDFATEQLLGTNGRHCETCHGNQQGWTSTPASFQERFELGVTYLTAACSKRDASNEAAATNDELEPIFRTVDGTNSPHADVSTPEARRAAYSMLLTKGVLRIGLEVPSDAEFELVHVDDPYGFASASELSLFRRSPLMANLRFNTTLMWDGRDTLPCATLTESLIEQAKKAVEGHAEGEEPPRDRLETMVRGELGIYTSQFIDDQAGPLHVDGARGGPTFLAQVPFYWGINSFNTLDPQGKPYDAAIFDLYGAWSELPADSATNQARRRIAEGERIFNTRQFTIRGVSGFNDELGLPEVTATCGACHNAPNVGTNSQGRLMDIGLSNEERRTPDLPLYTFRNKATGALTKTTDPGQALVTKTWAHLNRFKVPGLRSLAVRPPYFHHGAAATLLDVVEYHDRRFTIGLSDDETAALVAFLSAL